MKKNLLLLLLSFFFSVAAEAQITKSDEVFSNVFTIDGKVVFIKEIKTEGDLDKNYFTLKEWGKLNFARDPFISSVHWDDKKHTIVAKSRIELLLPEMSSGDREKMVMKYRLDAFFVENRCVVEISEISFSNGSKENKNTLPRRIKAEDIISDSAISINDSNKETRMNTKKSTLYFFNEIVGSLQNVLDK